MKPQQPLKMLRMWNYFGERFNNEKSHVVFSFMCRVERGGVCVCVCVCVRASVSLCTCGGNGWEKGDGKGGGGGGSVFANVRVYAYMLETIKIVWMGVEGCFCLLFVH